MHDSYLGIDVGGTKTECCLISLPDPQDFESYQILARERMPTLRETSLEDYLKRLNELITRILKSQKVELSHLKGMGIGLPGSIDPVRQEMVAGSIPFLLHIPLIPAFRKVLGYQGPLIFDNDANCFALAETYFGAGAKWAKENKVPLSQLCLIGITLGTGVGGGLFVNGKLVRGRRGGAGEVGHMTLIDAGYPCYCGKFGCSEQYLSGPAFQRSYSTYASVLEKATGPEIFKKIEAGDPLAVATLERYRDHLVTFLSNLSNMMDPHVIVLGGGMSTEPRIYTGIKERLSKACFLTANPPAVVPHGQGDSAGVIGAALLSYSQDTL